MKGRKRWLVIGMVVFLAIIISIDLREIPVGKALQAKATSGATAQVSLTLQTCDPTQGSYSGSLIPDLSIAGSDRSLSDIRQDEMVPESAWSTQAGFSISSPTDPEYWAQMLGAGWYIDWSVRSDPPFEYLEHWQMVRVHEDCISPSSEDIQWAAAHYPGRVWIIGNEPDVIWQDNVNADTYAAIYHDLYQLIKSADATALIAVGGVSQATPLRLQYLDLMLEAYQDLYQEPMPVDWWTVHGYVLREEKDSWGVEIPPGIAAIQGELREVSDHGRFDLFESQLRLFRQWMEERGYQHTPLALTEFGILMPVSYGFPTDFVASYLEQTFTWLSRAEDESIGYPEDGYHLVQRWAWFSISDPTYSASDLGDLPSGKLTIVGERFRNTISTMDP
ncbi:MAG: hypothetical protein A2032_04450 [Chloroflexi bacterium RBG_19FT_COMBO_49_13]|nr:MAG: hypothetical protein A2Y53_06395 [Chloroflexi bacterium RBG_16_47_49]OGO60422.1 MAG: hypothetical protein A2032_04450 [Chloroflexi bacterium RBG_19FT_COMBO_49_13]